MTHLLFQIDGAHAMRPGTASRVRIESTGSYRSIARPFAWCLGVPMLGVNQHPQGGRTT
ncbi:MAG: hypothetical protein ACWGPN_15430 [Gammaproteobacteria bacterium]